MSNVRWPIAEPAEQDVGAPEGVLRHVLERLLEVVTAETREIRAGRIVPYDEFNAQKIQLLLELSRLSQVALSVRFSAQVHSTIRQLAAALTESREVLRIQLRAAEKVSDLIASAIYEGQSDGTYSAHSWRD